MRINEEFRNRTKQFASRVIRFYVETNELIAIFITLAKRTKSNT